MRDSRQHWYVAIVKSCQDGKVAAAFEKEGVECYSPVRMEKRKWSDRVKTVRRRLIPGIVFVHCTDKVRRYNFERIPYLLRYMSEKRGSYEPAIIKDEDMLSFKMMVEESTNPPSIIRNVPFKVGDRVKVTEGPLEGLEAELLEVDGKAYVIARLSLLGAAAVRIDRNTITKIDTSSNET